ncbi:sugar kinase [Pedococcus sp. 5OH_020]|uniref:sugar kinase n=1 Tax=Pedococcus sp. 5OH_020 TaxID=2989814 RepID=UPI0022E9C3FE|nr:sugar kinase [Pedococcus sp. 5OH_020]
MSAPTTGRMPGGAPDVVVLGEVLVELSSLEGLHDGAAFRLGFSGDALNTAAAASAAGAHVALVARVPDDELGDELLARVRQLDVDTSRVIRAPGQHGLYLTHADPDGERAFTYVRRGSAGSQLGTEDLDDSLLSTAGVVVASGIACAISSSAAAAVLHAAQVSGRFVYDPNFRTRLTTSAEASAALRRIAPHAEVITPSWPGETGQLLGLPADTVPQAALTSLTALGAGAVVMTCGPAGAWVSSPAGVEHVPGLPAPRVVDQTGAGDCLTGTLAARLALGDSLVDAVRLATSAAALSVQGQGGTGYVPTLSETRRALVAARPAEELTNR